MIIAAKWIVPITRKPIKDGAIVVDNSKIVDFGHQDDILKKYPQTKLFNYPEGVILPGFINAHTHIELSLFKGKLPKNNFGQWLSTLVSKIRKLSEADLKYSCKIGIKQLIKSGVTAVGDIATSGFSVDSLMTAGLRAKVFSEFISPTYDEEKYKNYLAKVVDLADKTQNSLIEVGLSPHSVYTVNEKSLKDILEFANKAGFNVCMHLAESIAELGYIKSTNSEIVSLFKEKFKIFVEEKSGASSPVAYLLNNKLLNKKFVAVHVVQVDMDDTFKLKTNNCKIILCPFSNKYLGVGIAPIDLFVNSSLDFALGTDSLASNASLDVFKEAIYLAKIFPSLSSKVLVEALTINGAKALGLEQKIGSIEKNKEADIIVLGSAGKISNITDVYDFIIKGDWCLDSSWVAGKNIFKMG